MNRTPDVVVMAPGFLGFARFGGFYYFADRVVAVVRGLLEDALGRTVPVVPCMTLPTHSLLQRQRFLLDHLETLCTERLAGVERIHLIGHSTGGVDVQLLASTPRLDGKPWSQREEHVRARIASVVTISAPHHGTGLAESRLAAFAASPLRHPEAILPLARTLLNLVALVPREMAAAVGMSVARPNDVLRFLLQVLEHRELIGDLRPRHMEAVRRRVEPDPRIPLTCFVTGTVPRDDGDRPSDPFFADLWAMTAAGGEAHGSAPVSACRRLLEEALAQRPELVVASPTSHVPTQVDDGLNDGIVNSARQVVAAAPEQLGGIVIADHADVLGHYDRRDALMDGRPLNAGLFHSGAGFGDDEFFALYRRVAAAIARAVPAVTALAG